MKNVKSDLLTQFQQSRSASMAMIAPLEAEVCRIQPVAEVSPVWWNLAHTSWFYVKNVLIPYGGEKSSQDELFDFVLNSYYVSQGPRLARDHRGLMTRPTMKEVFAYRQSVDERMEKFINSANNGDFSKASPVIEIGIQHEQQHQELFYTEIKFILYQNPLPLRTPYLPKKAVRDISSKAAHQPHYIDFSGTLTEFGNLEKVWGWDNEYPAHKFYLNDFSIQNRLVTNREYLEFIEDGGYKNQLLWLDNGWNAAQKGGWKAPLYWELIDGGWQLWTLHGMEKLNANEPVCHVSYYEAEAFATWKKARLPTEREWEYAARTKKIAPPSGNFLDTGLLHPTPAQPTPSQATKELTQMLGDVWEWTSSYYEPYPGYTPYGGKLVEYNEKFMDNQRSLRGGSCVTERNHIRISYRNFWPADTRFQFTGIRLAL